MLICGFIEYAFPRLYFSNWGARRLALFLRLLAGTAQIIASSGECRSPRLPSRNQLFHPHPFPCLSDRTIFRCRALCSFGRIAKTEMPRGVGASANFIKHRTRRRARRECGQKRKVAATIGPFMLTFKPARGALILKFRLRNPACRS